MKYTVVCVEGSLVSYHSRYDPDFPTWVAAFSPLCVYDEYEADAIVGSYWRTGLFVTDISMSDDECALRMVMDS